MVKTTMSDAPESAAPGDDESSGGASSYLVPGLERGLRILAEFSAREPVLGAPELSKRIGIPRTTTFRLLQTLEALGFLERVNGDRYFRLGVGVLRLGFEYLNSLELTDLGTPVLERLRDTTGLSTHLLIRDQRDVVFVAKAQSNASMFGSVKVHVGTRLPAHATVHGHVLMGDLTRDALRQLYPEKNSNSSPSARRAPSTNCTSACAITRGSVMRSARRRSRAAFRRSRRPCAIIRARSSRRSPRRCRARRSARPARRNGSSKPCGAAVDLSQRLNYRPLESDPTFAHARHKVAMF